MKTLPSTYTGIKSLQPQDSVPAGLGRIGNRMFSVQEGGSARASRPGVFAKLRAVWADLRFYFSKAPDAARALRNQHFKAQENQRCLGDLLGYLSAPANKFKASSKSAQALVQLAKRSEGDITRLTGRHSQMAKLSDTDLIALRNGALNSPEVLKGVLGRIDSSSKSGYYEESLQADAQCLLFSLQDAVVYQFDRQVVEEPFDDIILALQPPAGRESVEEPEELPIGEKLKGPLNRLSRSLDQFRTASQMQEKNGELKFYFGRLPQETKQELRNLAEDGRLAVGLEALRQLDTNDYSEVDAIIMLDRISAFLKSGRDPQVESSPTER